jgi:hypothetical protein
MDARKVAKEKLPKNASQPQAALNQPSDEPLDALSPIIENLRRMLGAARHAFRSLPDYGG